MVDAEHAVCQAIYKKVLNDKTGENCTIDTKK